MRAWTRGQSTAWEGSGGRLPPVFLLRQRLPGSPGFSKAMSTQLVANTVGALAAVIYAFVATYILAVIIDRTISLRVTPDEEYVGLDICHHGERA